MMRYEVYHQGMLKAVSISSEYKITDFPYLEKAEIVNWRKSTIETKSNSNPKKDLCLNMKLHEIRNSELLKYFVASTEVDDPKINLIS